MIRHAPQCPVTAFFRFSNADGACVLAFPFRLQDPVTDFNDVMMDPALCVDVVPGEPDAWIAVEVRPQG